MARKSVAIAPDHVDVRGACGDAFLQDARAFVDEREDAAAHDFAGLDVPLRDLEPLRFGADQFDDLRVGRALAARPVVAIEAAPGLLAEAAEFGQPVGNAVEERVVRLAPSIPCGPGSRCRGPRGRRPRSAPSPCRNPARPCRPPRVSRPRASSAPFRGRRRRACGCRRSRRHCRPEWRSCRCASRRRRGRERLARGIAAAHDLDEAHHVGGAEEMHADDVGGPSGGVCDRVHVERRGVGREHGARACRFARAGRRPRA